MGWEGKWEGEMLCGDMEVGVEVRRGNEMWKQDVEVGCGSEM